MEYNEQLWNQIPDYVKSSYGSGMPWMNWGSQYTPTPQTPIPSSSFNSVFNNPVRRGSTIFDSVTPKPESPGLLSTIGKGLFDNFAENPLSFAGGIFDIYKGFQQLNAAKDYLNLTKDAYQFNKQLAMENAQRNREQWDMLKRQRASASL